jgi:uncharacterized membrane protein HdeD (DUF308 family)
MEMNPYAAPLSQILQVTSEDEFIRKQHINTEATLKSVGALYYLGAFALVVFGSVVLLGALMNGEPVSWMLGAFLLAVGVAQGMTAYGL